MRRSGRSSRDKSDPFNRVFAALQGEAKAGPLLATDAAELARRLERFEARMGATGLAELSPYMASLLRMPEKARKIRPVKVRRAAGF